jgi:DNA adenine methylase
MKPAFSYYGGKQRLASKILDYIMEIPHTIYVEPFAGAATLLFAKPYPAITNSAHYREVINDTNDLVINFYRIAQLQGEALHELLKSTLYSQNEHRLACSICKDRNETDPLIRAWAFYVSIQMSFSNKLNSGWSSCVYGYNLAATWNNKLSRFQLCLDRLRNVHIASEDALRCIERWDSPQTLFYLDPPYPNTDQGHYKGYTINDWSKLCSLLDKSQGSYVLSNYEQEIQPMADKIIKLNAVCSSSSLGRTGSNRDKSRAVTKEEMGDRSRTEILWICDRSADMRSDLKEIAKKNISLT